MHFRDRHRDALEAGGVGGRGCAVPPQRLLFVSTRAGKVAAVRALGGKYRIRFDAAGAPAPAGGARTAGKDGEQ